MKKSTRTFLVVALAAVFAAIQIAWFLVAGILLHLASMDGPLGRGLLFKVELGALLLLPTLLLVLVGGAALAVAFLRRRRTRSGSR